jgi:peptide deformylase
MAVLPILRWPDPRLSMPCAEIGGEDVAALARDMLETMYAAPGRGLAAPQVGVLKRLFVMDVTWKDGVKAPYICIDPVLREFSDRRLAGSEGCLSIPGLSLEVERAAEVVLDWTGLDGARRSERLTGFAATCAQHEMDHLDGIVTLDRLAPEARAAAEREYLA